MLETLVMLSITVMLLAMAVGTVAAVAALIYFGWKEVTS